ncbi:MAG: S8 family serine peptidase [bacterium]|nr:S8 family serine peptidase [bacterium]
MHRELLKSLATPWIAFGVPLFFFLVALLLAAPPAFAQAIDRESLAAFIAERSADVSRQRAAIEARAARLGLPLRAVTGDGHEAVLIRFDEHDGRPLYYVTDNLNAARTVSTDRVWPGGDLGLDLDGFGQVIGQWDGGDVRDTHQELAGRVTNLDGAGLSDHATHVAGTLIAGGVLNLAQGMAFTATVRSHDFVDDEIEMAGEQLEPEPIRVSNHSYSLISGWTNGSFGCANGGDPQWYWFGDVIISTQEDLLFGYYDDSSADWDQITFDSPLYLPLKSAGNNRGQGPSAGTPHCHWDGSLGGGEGDWVADTDVHALDGAADGGYDSISGGAGSAKNILTIGAVADIPDGYDQPSDVVMTFFSGWGPTDDGRIKPDLVANGVSLTSSLSFSDSAYGAFSGTSMSTPNTAGSLALLHQHALNLFGLPFRAATMKALLIHTADEAGTTPGPDYAFGWGLVNTAGAADVLSAQAATPFHIQEDTLADSSTLEYQVVSDGGSPLCVTVAWTDPPGAVSPPTAIDVPDPKLVNDLDLRIEAPDRTVFSPWVLDPDSPPAAAVTGDNARDNVEQVWIESPAAGIYTVRVSHKGSLLNTDPQDVSVIVSGQGTGAIFADGFESGDTGAWSGAVP